MKKKTRLFRWIAVSGLGVVLLVVLSRFLIGELISTEIKSAMLVVGLAMMLLGTLWRVVTEMNDQEDSSDSSPD